MTPTTKQTTLFPDLDTLKCQACGGVMVKIGTTDVIECYGVREVPYYQCVDCKALGIDEEI